MLNNEQTEKAMTAFLLNTKFYPESANCWDSLAESYWKNNDTETAIQYYNKAIELDEGGGVAENSRNMLAQIEKEKQVK